MEKPVLTFERARAVIAGCTAEARRNNWLVVMAVVDDGGHLISLDRMDDTQFGSVDVAIGKGRAAVAFKRPTKAWVERIATGQIGVVTAPGALAMEGGVPLMFRGRVVGGVGVSGVKSEQDGQIAAAGAAALADSA